MAGRHAWLGLLILAFSQSSRAADPDDILRQAITKLRNTLQSLPQYACIETVERQYFKPNLESAGGSPSCSELNAADPQAGSQTLDATDRLRLEVTLSEGREIYSWPGATRFDSRDIGDIIRQGPIGTGSFGTHLIALFDNPGVRLQFAGEEISGGHTVFVYRFDVPLAASRYHMKMGKFRQSVAYEGTFRVDTTSLELQSLNFQAQALPPDASVCRLDGDLDFRGPSAGGANTFLPVQSQLRMVLESGRQTNNITKFSECRVYRAESALRFDDSPQLSERQATRIVRVPTSLPIGLPIVLALTAPIDTATAAAGDPVSAKVLRAVRQPGTNITLIPSGAIVLGRLTRVEHHFLPSPYFLVGISFNRLDWQGAFAPFAAHSEGSAGLARELNANLSDPGGGFGFWNGGTFLFPTGKKDYIIPAGFQSKWITLAVQFR